MVKTNKEIIEEVLKGYHPSYNNNRITDMLEKALQLKEQEEIKFLEKVERKLEYLNDYKNKEEADGCGFLKEYLLYQEIIERLQELKK